MIHSSAVERNFLGYLRTASALSMTSVILAQLFTLQRHPNAKSRFGYYAVGKPLAVIFMGFAIAVIGLGAFRFWRQQNALVRGKVHAGGWELYSIGLGFALQRQTSSPASDTPGPSNVDGEQKASTQKATTSLLSLRRHLSTSPPPERRQNPIGVEEYVASSKIKYVQSEVREKKTIAEKSSAQNATDKRQKSRVAPDSTKTLRHGVKPTSIRGTGGKPHDAAELRRKLPTPTNGANKLPSRVRRVDSSPASEKIQDAKLKPKPKLRLKPTPFAKAEGNETIQEALGGNNKVFNRRGVTHNQVEVVDVKDLRIEPIDVKGQPPVPDLSYGLERVLFNPGVYHLQDPRSRVFNFDPYLQKVMPVAEFDFNALKRYITSSQDESLRSITQSQGKKYMGSSSSMTGALAHFHFLLSQWRPITTRNLSQGFRDKLRSFTKLQRSPSAIFLHWQDGSYAIDADKQFDTANILSMLGKSMEKLLTLSTDEYERYRKTTSDPISEDERNESESFHYCSIGDFLMRSQLDAHDARLPGTGMFDLKTRAVVSIRMDVRNYSQGAGYEIKDRYGDWESFEREYFDMIRAAFLKYSLQVRMGRMDGIFVAFHNTERLFGFQYISLPEMDIALHDAPNTLLGDQEFKVSLTLLNKILDRATAKFPKQSLRLHFETRESETPFMYIFAEPVTAEEVESIQSTNKSKIEEFERKVLGLEQGDEVPSAEVNDGADKGWEALQTKVEEEMDEDELFPDRSARHSGSEEEEEEGRGLRDSEDHLSQSEDSEESERSQGSTQNQTAASLTKDDSVDDDLEEADKENTTQGHIEEEGAEDKASEDLDLMGREARGDSKKNDDEAYTQVKNEALDSSVREQEDESAATQVGGEVPEEANGDANTQSLEDEPQQTESGSETQSEVSEVFSSADLGEEIDATSPNAEDSASDGDGEFLNEVDQEQNETLEQLESRSLLALTLTIRNKVNGEYVRRPEQLKQTDKWMVEYSLGEVTSASRAVGLYEACQTRRRNGLAFTEEGEQASEHVRRLRELSLKGRRRRRDLDRLEAKSAPVVMGVNPSAPADVAAEESES
ncbi:MAG: hypothetical protein M1833_001469 [Piccolia ochrophora]|nr:MAG: hypothetical protein M1833_001469 [Piccolia ochrophora]